MESFTNSGNLTSTSGQMPSSTDNPTEEKKYFPYDEFPAQESLMSNLYTNLLDENKKVLLMESPTGTGKTLMLFSTLMRYLAQRPKETPLEQAMHKSSDIPKKKGGKYIVTQDFLRGGKIPEEPKDFQIFFCTRTHSQINQLIEEAKRIQKFYQEKYNEMFPFNFSFALSRKQLCINTEYDHLSISALNNKCRDLNSNTDVKKRCKYHDKTMEEIYAKDCRLLIKTVEDFKSLATRLERCPFYASRINLNYTDFVFLTYNFILNKSIRKSVGLNLNNSFIIFDEAHNIIESTLQNLSTQINFDFVLSFYIGLCFYHKKFLLMISKEHEEQLRTLIKFTIELMKFFFKKDYSTISSFTTLNDTQNSNMKNPSQTKENIIYLSDFTIDNNMTDFDLFKLVDFIDEFELGDKIRFTLSNISSNTHQVLSNLKKDKKKINQSSISEEDKKILFSFLEEDFDSEIEDLKKEIESITSFFKYKNLNEANDIINKMTLFIKGIANTDENGVLIYKPTTKEINFQMFNPEREFTSLLKEASKLIFIGGTMRPFEDFQSLFKNQLSENQMFIYEGDHVISSGQIHPYIINKNIFLENSMLGVNAPELSLTYKNIKANEANNILCILNYIKNYYDTLEKANLQCGIAAFFPSYDLLNTVISYNKKNKILKEDSLFYEVSSNSKGKNEPNKSDDNLVNESEEVFEKYSKNIKIKKKLSIILAVMRGKLSEGINFSGDLARVLIIFGLPFLNVNSIDLKMKMQYYDDLKKQGKSLISGNDYYLNSCMKNVNQTIGRCIRNYKDYSILILADSRYETENIMTKLPKWVLKENITKVQSKREFEYHLTEIKTYLNKMKEKEE